MQTAILHQLPENAMKPFDPREQTVADPHSLIRAIRDAQQQRAEFTRKTGIPVDPDGFLVTDGAERRGQLQRIAAMNVLRDIVDEYGAARVRLWITNIAATPSTVQQVVDDLAAGEEIQ